MDAVKEPAYIPIHCEKQRRRDMRWRYRSVRADGYKPPGLTYAQKVDGRWECCCCGKRVLVVW